MNTTYDIIIIGSGPAGLTASIYASRAQRSVLILAGSSPGGQLMLTTEVEDFPGFKSIQGPALMEKILGHARSFGAEYLEVDVEDVKKVKNIFEVKAGKREFRGRSVIVATGASAKWLELESEKKLIGKGVSACATCDAPFFRDLDVAVIGGGDTALREALHLAKVCKSVIVIHRRDSLRAQKILQERAMKTKNVSFLWNHVVEEFVGDGRLEALIVKDLLSKKKKTVTFQGAFVAIGHTPNTEFLKGLAALDSHGYINVHEFVKTSVKGLFAAGDVYDYHYMQAVTAAGAGCMAAMDADHYLDEEK